MSMTVAQAAERTGLTTHTLRYYERDGLMLRDVSRSNAGHRRYTERDIAGIVLIARLRATGMPTREVRRYAALVRAGAGNEQERLDMLRGHRERACAQLAQVREHLSAIDRKIGIYLETQGLTSSALEAVESAP